MTKSTVDVAPSEAENKLPVLGHLVDGVFVPIYSIGVGAENEAPTLVSETAPLPTTLDNDSSNPLSITDALVLSQFQILNEALNDLTNEQKLTNKYLSDIVGEDLRLDNEMETL